MRNPELLWAGAAKKSVFTPRGLKIRIPVEHAFSLMERLRRADPATDAFRVLKTAEAIELVPMVLGLVAGTVSVLAFKVPLAYLVAVIPVARLVGLALTQCGLFTIIRPLGLLWLSRIASYISGFGLLELAVCVALAVRLGWIAAVYWIGAHLLAWILEQAIEWRMSSRLHRRTGLLLFPSEVNFFNAYRLHADRLGQTRDVDVAESEAQSGAWMACFADLAHKWPQVAIRIIQA